MSNIYLLPTPKALANLDIIQDDTGLTVTAYGKLVKPRKPSALFDEMCGMARGEAERLLFPFGTRK